MVILVLLTAGGIFGVVFLGARDAVDRLSRILVSHSAEELEASLDGFFVPVERSLLVARDWGAQGSLDLEDPEGLNARFMPLLSRLPQVSSMLIARSDGLEYMLLEDGDGWINRQTRAEEWGRRTRWMRWSSHDTLEREWWEERDYDPRDRPWYAVAMEAEGEPGWTEPYTFFTTRDPGVTVAVRWTPPGPDALPHVVAFDVMLLDVSAFTGELDVSERGTAIVLTEEGKVLGLPSGDRFATPDARRASVLEPLEALGLEVHDEARRRTESSTGPFTFEHGGESWWAGFERYALGPHRDLQIGVVVPEADLVGDARRQQRGILGVTAVALILAVIMALVFYRRLRGRMDLEIQRAKQIGQYNLERRIGQGGMGDVYRATHSMLKRPTALKLLHPDRAEDADSIARFEREVRITSTLTHPNTIQVYDYGRTPEGVFYYAMELLPGVTLTELVKRTGAVPPGRAIHILRQACGSLEEAHRAGLIHRDIKPGNIMITERGGDHDVVKVLDFGLVKRTEENPEGSDARLTYDNTLTGTPLYMSPESIVTPDEVNARSDLYALGAVGYFLLTGSPPFDGQSAMEVCSKHVAVDPEPPSARLGAPLPADLERIVLDCLAKHPEDRPVGAAELSDRLGACEDAHAWTEADAAAWWKAHAGRFPGVQAEDASDRGRAALTLTVDLGGRQRGERNRDGRDERAPA